MNACLVGRGAESEIKPRLFQSGATPLHMACSSNNLGGVEVLLKVCLFFIFYILKKIATIANLIN